VALAHYYGIDRSPLAQYFSWMGSVLTGNLGLALNTHISGHVDDTRIVARVSRARDPCDAARHPGRRFCSVPFPPLARMASATRWVRRPGLLGLSVPSFVLATAIVTVVASKFNYFPNGGEYKAPWQNLSVNLQMMLFPALVLGFAVAAPVMRTTRSAMIEVASRDFVRTARGNGRSPEAACSSGTCSACVDPDRHHRRHPVWATFWAGARDRRADLRVARNRPPGLHGDRSSAGTPWFRARCSS